MIDLQRVEDSMPRHWLSSVRKEIVQWYAEQLEKTRELKDCVPGLWFCPKCKFQKSFSFLSSKDGSVGTDNDPRIHECPNDATLMQRMTWREHAEDICRGFELQVQRAVKAEQQLTEMDAARLACAAKDEAINGLIATAPHSGEGIQRIRACQNGRDALSPSLGKGLMEELVRLRGWKKEMLAVEAQWDPQQIGREMGLPIGIEIRKELLPAIRKHLTELEFYRDAINRIKEVHKDDVMLMEYIETLEKDIRVAKESKQ